MRRWVIPPRADAAFVAAMEDVLEVYARPVEAARPLVCFDESGKALRGHKRAPLPPAPGREAREDTAYQRGGAANLCLACAPHLGWRDVRVTARRTAVDFAHALRALVDQQFPEAERIVLVTDNLNTHRPSALYKTFPAAEARRIVARLEWHYTPTHGSWLNLAELELSALARQCLDRRLPDRPTLAQEVAAWVATRNADQIQLVWTFGISEARVRLAHCYPLLEQDTSTMSVHST